MNGKTTSDHNRDSSTDGASVSGYAKMWAMSPIIDVLLLLALPASGKSEVRRYLEYLDPDRARSEMHLGPTVQLDDYPYVHLMRRISQELSALGADPKFFSDDLSPWNDPRDWLTLIHLVNEDYLALGSGIPADPDPAALLDRIDRARHSAGAPAPFGLLAPGVRTRLEAALASDTAELAASLPRYRPADSTVVIEFARGGPDGAALPLPHPLGYAASLAALDPAIVERSSILYVWVEPGESRRRNRDRARPGPEGDASILHHGVPEAVMLQDYGTDDMTWLRSQQRHPRTIPVGGLDLPCAWFDNRRDHTSFLRADPADWSEADVNRLHSSLAAALDSLVDRT